MLNPYKVLNKILLLILVPNIALAWQVSDDVSVHGFINQAVVKTDHNNYLGKSTETSFSPFEIGLNAFWQPNNDLSFAVQSVWQRYSDKVDTSVDLDYAFGRYTLRCFEDISSYVELGRVKVDYGLFNSVRDIPFARPPGLHVPNSVYLLGARDLLLSIDGINTAFTLDLDKAHTKLSLYSGVTNSDSAFLEEYMFKNDVDGQFEHYRKSGASLISELNTKLPITLGVSYMGMHTRLEKGQATMNLALDSLVYSLKLEAGDFTFLFEKSDTLSHVDDVNLPILDPTLKAWLESNKQSTYVADNKKSTRKTTGFYIGSEYTINTDLTWFMRYEEQKLLQKSSDIESFLDLGYIKDRSQVSTHAWFTGVSYFLKADVLLNLEYGVINGTSYLNTLDNPDFSKVKNKWHLLGLSVAYQF